MNTSGSFGNFPPKKADVIPIVSISAIRHYVNGACGVDFKLSSAAVETIDKITFAVTLHAENGDTIDSEYIAFSYIDTGKSGNVSRSSFEKDVCPRTAKIIMRQVTECSIGGVRYENCGKYISIATEPNNLLALR